MKRKIFQTQEDPFSKNAQGINKSYYEVVLIMKFLQSKREVKNMDFIYYDLYNTVIKTRDENKDIDNQYQNDYNDFITPNHYVGIKPRETLSGSVETFEILNKSLQVILTI